MFPICSAKASNNAAIYVCAYVFMKKDTVGLERGQEQEER